MTEQNYWFPSQSDWNEICQLVQAGLSVSGRDILANAPAKVVKRHIESLNSKIERLQQQFQTAGIVQRLGNLPTDVSELKHELAIAMGITQRIAMSLNGAKLSQVSADTCGEQSRTDKGEKK